MLHSVYDQVDADAVHAQFDKLLDSVGRSLPTVAAHLDDARADLLAFTTFPQPIWRQIWSICSASARSGRVRSGAAGPALLAGAMRA